MGFSRLGEATKVINDGVLRVFICALDRKTGRVQYAHLRVFFFFALVLPFLFLFFFFND